MEEYFMPLVRREEIAEGTMAFWLDRKETGFEFKAGQFAQFTIQNPPETDEKGNTRPLSIASSPHIKETIMIAMRMRGSAFKNSLKIIQIGTEILVRGPFGSFTLHEDEKKPAVFIAGGIGITPFRSIIEWATEEGKKHKIFLFYSNRTLSQTAFLKDFEKFAEENKNFVFIPTLTQEEKEGYEKGRINIEMIKRHADDLEKSIYYIAGPPGMVSGISEMLEQAGIKKEQIRTEKFSGY